MESSLPSSDATNEPLVYQYECDQCDLQVCTITQHTLSLTGMPCPRPMCDGRLSLAWAVSPSQSMETSQVMSSLNALRKLLA